MKVLIVSPHRDDAAFSLTLSIASWLRRGHSVHLLNCFTKSGYAPLAAIHEADQDDRVVKITELRRLEDQSWRRTLCAKTAVGDDKLTVRDLGLLDAPLRLRCSDIEVCDLAASTNSDESSTIFNAVAAFDGEFIALPLGLGHHVDHVTARDAALRAATSRPHALYEDLPYAARPGAFEQIPATAAAVASPLYEAFVETEAEAAEPARIKMQAASCYASQITSSEIETMATFSSRYGGRERLWVNPRWMETEHLRNPANS